MDYKPKISVLIPAYNAEATIIKALDSIPEVYEIILCDDSSTDTTVAKARSWSELNQNVIIATNKINLGVGQTYNRLLNLASGDWIIRLDSDDYFLPEISQVFEQLSDDIDMLYFNIIDNTGHVHILNEARKMITVGACKLISREFLGDSRCQDVRVAEDYWLQEELLAKNPREKFTNITAYHYDFPREGSLSDLRSKGYFND